MGVSLPLVQHLEDTRLVAGYLWDTWLPSIFTQRVSAAADGEEAGRSLLMWLAAIHDCGKATPSFATMAYDIGMDHLLRPLTELGVAAPSVARSQRRHHPLTGQAAVERWLADRRGFSPRRARQVGGVVGSHHGLMPDSLVHRDVSIRFDDRSPAGAFGTAEWGEIREEILETMTARSAAEGVLAHLRDAGLPMEVQLDLTSAVIVADWIASDAKAFPYLGLNDPQKRWLTGCSRIRLAPPWIPTAPPAVADDVRLSDRFPHLADVAMRPFQTEVLRAAAAESPPLLVIEAAMGTGKTEAALLAAEALSVRWGCGGVFIGLPTMATSDAMFSRVLQWLRHVPVDHPASIFLAHSKSELNDAYDALVSDAFRAKGVFDQDTPSQTTANPVVALWTTGRKRGVLANQVIGTIDQALFAGLQTKHLALRHLGLSTKVVIVDEVHAADDYMRSYLCKVLSWLGRYGTPVILMSATLPTPQREQLVRAYLRGRVGARAAEQMEVPAATGYPHVTVVTDRVVGHPVAQKSREQSVHVEVLPGDVDAIAGRAVAEVAEGGCALVVCSTVARAQVIHELVGHRLTDEEVMLVHSRFIGPDRLALESRVRRMLGPPHDPSVARPRRLVVVGTQVLEQSLDIDADVMLSDIAPADLVLQRSGRLHRHARPPGSRPSGLRCPRLILTGMTLHRDGPPEIDGGPVAVYRPYRLLRSVEALGLADRDMVTISLPDGIPKIVERAYDESVAPPRGWEETWARERERWRRHIEASLSEAAAFQIPDVDRRRDLVGFMQAPVTADHDDPSRGRAQVRDGDEGVEVVLVVRGEDGQVRVMPGDFEGAGGVIPLVLGHGDDVVAKAAASSTVRLPMALTHPRIVDEVIAQLESEPIVAGWQQNRWLRGQLVVVLDHDLTTRLCAHELRYDRTRGLIVEARKEETDGSGAP